MAGLSNVTPVAVASGSGDVEIYDGPCNLYGFSFKPAAATQIFLRDGSATGPVLAFIELAANTNKEPTWFGPQGIRVNTSIWIDRDGTNAVEGTIYVG